MSHRTRETKEPTAEGVDTATTTPVDLAERRRIFDGIVFCATAFVTIRLVVFAVGLVGVGLFPPLEPVGVPGWPATPLPDPGWHNLFTAWERFDALWFLRIADTGYHLADGSAAFFPMFPITTRILSLALGGAPFGAAMLVSNAAFFGALIATYFLTSSELSERMARTTVLLLCFFPTSYFFLMPYSESLFLLFAVISLWGARRRRWVVAGVAGALAALTRSVGIALVPALLVEALHQRAERRGPVAAGVAAAGTVAGALVLYLVLWGVTTGEWVAPLTRQANWEREFSWPWVTLWDGTSLAFRYLGATNGGYWLIDWLIVVPMLGASAYALMRFRPAFSIFLWGGLLLPLTFVFPGRPLMSMPRFLLPLFPAFWAVAVLCERFRVPRWAVLSAGAVGLGVLCVLTVNWYYIF